MSRGLFVRLKIAGFTIGCSVLGCGAEPLVPAGAPLDKADRSAAVSDDGAPSADESLSRASHPAAEAEPQRKLPEACEPGPFCAMPKDFGERLCAGTYPEVAFHFFAPGSPWKRAYLQKSFKAWHVGGRGELRELRAGEEVVIVSLGGKPGGGGMQMGGQAFDVLRWDGTCVSLMEDELSFHKPSSAMPANISYKALDSNYRSFIAEDKAIAPSLANQERLCNGKAAEKEPGKTKCEFAKRHLSRTIAQAVGSGRKLPAPPYVP